MYIKEDYDDEKTKQHRILANVAFSSYFYSSSLHSIHIAIKKGTQCTFTKPKIQYMPIKDINNNL